MSNNNHKLVFGNGNIILGVDLLGYIHAYETADSKKCGTNAVDFDPSKCVHHRIPVDSIVELYDPSKENVRYRKSYL